MKKYIAATLPTAAQVTDGLLDRFGPDQIWQVERLGDRLFRAWMTDGTVVLARVMQDGNLDFRKQEGWI